MIRLSFAFALLAASTGALAQSSGTNPMPGTAVDVVVNLIPTNANPGLDIPQSSVDEPEYDPYAEFSAGVVRGLLSLNRLDDAR